MRKENIAALVFAGLLLFAGGMWAGKATEHARVEALIAAGHYVWGEGTTGALRPLSPLHAPSDMTPHPAP